MLMFGGLTKWILGLFLVAEGGLLTFGLPPFQKFDETVHFTRAVALSEGQFFCKNSHFVIPKALAGLHEKYNFQKVLLENEKFPTNLVDFGKRWAVDDLKESVEIGGCGLSFLGYVPNALGVWLTGWTSRPAVIFYAGRIFGFLFLLLMLKTGLKIIDKRFGYLLWFYALMPMVVHQATSFSHDVVILGLILPLTALWLSKYRGGMVYVIVLIISIIKPVYLPLTLLFGLNKRKILIIGLMLALIVGMGKIGKGEANYPTFVNPKLQVLVIKNDPIYFLEVVKNTWMEKFLPHFEEMVGVMGWRNTPMTNNYLNFIFVGFGLLVVMKLAKDLKTKIGLSELVIIGGVIFLVTFLSTLAMYLVWSPVGDKSVEGIQGRYWLLLVPLWLVLIGRLAAWIREKRWFRNLVLGLVLAGVVANIGQSLWARYFDWSGNRVNNLDAKMSADGLLIIDKETALIRETKGKNVSGLALNLDNRNKKIIVPYQYRIMDKECKKTLRRGYLKPWDIQGERQMILEFESVRASSGSLCLRLTPLLVDLKDYTDRLTIKVTYGQPQMEWLYFGE